LYYLFAAHHWGLTDLKALWEGGAGWHDLIYALASYEAEQRAQPSKKRRGKAVKATKRKK
jgi:hypothetical protein